MFSMKDTLKIILSLKKEQLLCNQKDKHLKTYKLTSI